MPSRETVAKVEEFAGALGVAAPELADIRLLAEGHMLLAKLDFLRRGHIKDIFKNQLEQKGPLGFATHDPLRRLPEADQTRGHHRVSAERPSGRVDAHLVAETQRPPEHQLLVRELGVQLRDIDGPVMDARTLRCQLC